MLDGDLTAVVTFIGVVVQLGGELLLVLLFVLLRGYVLRRGYFAAWTGAWAFGAIAIAALCVRYIIMPGLGASEDDASLPVRGLYLAYQVGKLTSLALFVSGTAMYATGTRILAPRATAFGLIVAYSVVSLVASDGSLNQLVVWQAPVAVIALGACAALLFTLPSSRRTLGSMAGGAAFTGLGLLWLLYGVAFGLVSNQRGPGGWPSVVLSYNTYLDLLLNVALGFAMVVVLMEDAKREVDDAQSELRVAHDQLRRSALYDSLTDSLNREAFAQGVGLEMARGTFGTVVIADLDNLKQVNDTYGHPSGDKLLRQCADLLRSTLRPYDKLYRWGGDEFLLILSSARSSDVLARLTDILAAASPMTFGEGATVRLAVSLGASDYTSAEMIEDSIRLADEAMYRDKNRRKSPEYGFRAVPTPSGSVRIQL